MDGVQDNLIAANDETATLFNLFDSSAEGWKPEDLKMVLSSAESLRSKKSVARIKAASRLALFSRNRGPKSGSFAELLFSLNPFTRFIRASSNYIVVEVAANFRFPKLPAGYAFKGGAARIALANVIGHDTKNSYARDFDLVRFSQGNWAQDLDLSARIMSEDFLHGHSVEIIKHLDEYFASRDLTINEVLFFGKKLIFTQRAFEDLKAGIIRPSEFLKKSGQLSGTTVCKMLRLAAEFAVNSLEFKIQDFPDKPTVNRSQMNLHRQRASEQGKNVERRYIELCEQYLGVNPDFFISTAAPRPNRQVSRSLCSGNGILRLRKRP